MNRIATRTTVWTLLAVAGIAGCAGPAATTLPDGTVAYRVNCDTTSRGLNYCFENAGRTCGADGYSVIANDGTRLSPNAISRSQLQALTAAYQENRNSILIACGE